MASRKPLHRRRPHGESNLADEEKFISTYAKVLYSFGDRESGELSVSGNGNDQRFEEERVLVALLKDCAHHKDLYKGSKIHTEISSKGLLDTNIFIGTTLVDMYVKCGAIKTALEVFDDLPARNVVSWNALISGYCEHGQGEEVLMCFERMQEEGISPSTVTYTCTMKACGILKAHAKGQQIHAEIVRGGLQGRESKLGTSLVDMYAKFGALTNASQVFHELPVQDVVSWTVLIGGYVNHGYAEEALTCFELMKLAGLVPDTFTFRCVLQACGCIGAADKGEKLHVEIDHVGLLKQNSVLSTALVDMYIKCGALAKAEEVFHNMCVRDLVSWNALIAGYCQHDHGEEALGCLELMQREGLSPDAMTFASILKVCGIIGAVEKGESIHLKLVKLGLLGDDVVLSAALLEMYARCGVLAKAQRVFDELPVFDKVIFTMLITRYCQQGHVEEALKCFFMMESKGLSSDEVTFACILEACAYGGAAEKGNEVHAHIARAGLLEKVTLLGSAVVDMYAKCGALAKAQEVFDLLSFPNVVSWTALIAGHAQAGDYDDAFRLFDKMLAEGIEPTLVTFSVVLNACRSLGLVDKGQCYFEALTSHYGIVPTLEQYTSMIDLFGRTRHFDKLAGIIKKMPHCDQPGTWLAILSSCQNGGNMSLARLGFEHAISLDGKSALPYVLMRNIYADAGMEDDADRH